MRAVSDNVEADKSHFVLSSAADWLPVGLVK